MTDRTDRYLDAALIAAIWIALVAMMFGHAARVDQLTAGLDYPPVVIEDVAAPGVRHEVNRKITYVDLEPQIRREE